MSDATIPPSQLAEGEETVTLTIDGKEVTVPEGTLVIRAAEQLGIVIPRFCDHPLLDPAGACRQCIVEIEDSPKPATSCTTEVQDGMVVKTHLTSEVAEEAQEGQLEFLLINHPLDCPMCDKGGECPLQDQALEYGPGESRFIDEKRRYEKPVAVSPNVLLDRERCVLCARCTRFAQQISGDPFIELFERGALQQVAIFEDEPYESYFSGNVIQICPVGALTSASYRFRARPFDLQSHPSVCNMCSAGCNLNVHSRRGGIMRQLARTNMNVNEAWNCDKGRFAFDYVSHPSRVTVPAVRREGDLAQVSWTEALDAAADALRDVDPTRVGFLSGGRIPDEDAWALSRFARTVVGTDNLDFRTWTAGPDEDAALSAVATRPGVTYRDVERASIVVLVGLDPEEEVPILYLRLRKAWRERGQKLVSVGPRAGTVSELLWERLATPPRGEAGALRRLADPSSADGALGEVARALAEAGEDVIVLVGERGANSPGTLAAAGALADELGGRVSWVPRRNNARGALDAGLAAGMLPGGRRLDDDGDRAAVSEVWGELPQETGRPMRDLLESAARGELDVLYLVGVDIARDADRPRLAKAALERTPTVIVHDVLETETARYADVLLPAAPAQERSGTYTNWEGRHQRFQQAIDAPALVQEDWDILRRLSAVLGHDLGYRDLGDIRDEISGLDVAASRPWPQDAGASEDGTGDGLELLTYPLLLDRGVMSIGADGMLATAKGPFAAINPEDAERIGVRSGDQVAVASDDGRLVLPVHVEDDVVAGTVFVPSNSTEAPATTLAADDTRGPVRVRVTEVDQ